MASEMLCNVMGVPLLSSVVMNECRRLCIEKATPDAARTVRTMRRSVISEHIVAISRVNAKGLELE